MALVGAAIAQSATLTIAARLHEDIRGTSIRSPVLEFIIGANEGFGAADTCVKYPRPTNLGNALDAYVVEVTGKKFGKPFPLTLDINKPENCQAAKASGASASITEHSVYNKNGAAFVMMEFGRAGLRVFDLRDGEHPKEVAYYNDGAGHVHSGVFHYDEARGLPEHGIAPGTRWVDIPADWVCPDCGTPKNGFEMVEISYSPEASAA